MTSLKIITSPALHSLDALAGTVTLSSYWFDQKDPLEDCCVFGCSAKVIT